MEAVTSVLPAALLPSAEPLLLPLLVLAAGAVTSTCVALDPRLVSILQNTSWTTHVKGSSFLEVVAESSTVEQREMSSQEPMESATDSVGMEVVEAARLVGEDLSGSLLEESRMASSVASA